jgi:hypothetical protein
MISLEDAVIPTDILDKSRRFEDRVSLEAGLLQVNQESAK